jgi:WD40 repeat protein
MKTSSSFFLLPLVMLIGCSRAPESAKVGLQPQTKPQGSAGAKELAVDKAQLAALLQRRLEAGKKEESYRKKISNLPNEGFGRNRIAGYPSGGRELDFSRDGRYVAFTSKGGKSFHVWDLSEGRDVGTFTGHTDTISGLQFTPDSTKIWSASYDKSIRLWDVESKKSIRQLDRTEGVGCLSISPDGQQLAFFDGIWWTNIPLIKDLKSGEEIRLPDGFWNMPGIHFAPSGSFVASVHSHARKLILSHPRTGKKLSEFEVTYPIRVMAISADGSLVAVGGGIDGEKGTVTLCNVIDNSKREIADIASKVCELSFSPDGKMLVCDCWTVGTGFALCDVESGKILGYRPFIGKPSFSPGGTFFATSGNDFTLYLTENAFMPRKDED